MIEIRNITKIYHSKTGASVKALDNVSVSFPERGMVFILGKSGSGKSTLLNVIGGLDGCDSGEFIIKGKSSKDFVGSDFDAYRNTFIGFIFQEYNILDDFSVGANIGLALELQGKKATSEKINRILSDVDLLDYAKRKPNELSGGQKQRVAIARALVKDPEIIMADEPTGALDSNTGKQIFDTLKELSKTKLVIVVSHDIDFAEKYGDRIIEMKDGQIFRDVTKHEVESVALSSGILKMSDDLLRIERGYQLTTADLALINEYLAKQSAEILISGNQRLNDNVRSEAGISQNNCTAVFDNTDPEKDVELKNYDGKKTKFIKSRLPMKNAIKIGSSSLGHKKFRLVMTIFLSLIAFALFGFADTLGGYEKVTAATESIIDSHVQNASFSLSIKSTWTNGEKSYDYFDSTALNEKDIARLSKETGLSFVPVFNGASNPNYGGLSVSGNMIDSSKLSSGAAYTGTIYGFSAMSEAQIKALGLSVTGKMPTADDEIAISKFMYEQFNYAGFRDAVSDEKIEANSLTMAAGDSNSIIGKYIKVYMNGQDYVFKVTAVIDTNFEYSRYQKFIPSTNANEAPTVPTEDDTIVDMILQMELQNTLKYGFHALGYVTEDAIDSMSEHMVYFGMMDNVGTWMNWNMQMVRPIADGNTDSYYLSRVAKFSEVEQMFKIDWIDSNGKLDEDEVLISTSRKNVHFDINTDIADKFQSAKAEVLGEYADYDIRYGAIEKYMNENFDQSMINALKASFVQYNYYETDNIEELRSHWRNLIEWGDAHSVNSKDAWALEEEARAEIFKVIFGKYAVGATQELMNNFNFEYSTSFSLSNAKRYLAYKYAQELLTSTPKIMNSKEFEEYIISRYTDIEYWKGETITDDERRYTAIECLTNALAYPDMGFTCKESWYTDGVKIIEDNAFDLYTTVTGETISFDESKITISITSWDNGTETKREYTNYKIAGYFEDSNASMSDLIVSNEIYDMHDEFIDSMGYGKTTVTPHEKGIYAFAIAPMPTDKATIQNLVELNYTEIDDGFKFELQNQVMDTLNSFNDFIEVGAKVFLYIGIGFAVFAGLMLMNFISVSISYKRREIGILRAVGARSSDVFKIFFSEAAIIALINYVLSLAATITGVIVFNNFVRSMGVNVTLLNFGVRQVVLMLAISLLVAAISSFLPVWNIARRKPVDAIKNK